MKKQLGRLEPEDVVTRKKILQRSEILAADMIGICEEALGTLPALNKAVEKMKAGQASEKQFKDTINETAVKIRGTLAQLQIDLDWVQGNKEKFGLE